MVSSNQKKERKRNRRRVVLKKRKGEASKQNWFEEMGVKTWGKIKERSGRKIRRKNHGRKGTLASRAELTERGLHRYEGFNICTNCHDSIFR